MQKSICEPAAMALRPGADQSRQGSARLRSPRPPPGEAQEPQPLAPHALPQEIQYSEEQRRRVVGERDPLAPFKLVDVPGAGAASWSNRSNLACHVSDTAAF